MYRFNGWACYETVVAVEIHSLLPASTTNHNRQQAASDIGCQRRRVMQGRSLQRATQLKARGAGLGCLYTQSPTWPTSLSQSRRPTATGSDDALAATISIGPARDVLKWIFALVFVQCCGDSTTLNSVFAPTFYRSSLEIDTLIHSDDFATRY